MLTKLVLETNFSHEDQDEGQSLLQPTKHSFELRQSRGWSSSLFLGALLGVPVPLGAGHVQQRGAAVLPVLEVVGRLPVVERGPLSPAGPLVPRGRHLDEHFPPSGRRAQQQPRLEGRGREGARGDPGQAREELRGRGLGLEALEHPALIHAGFRAHCLAPVPAVGTD